MSGYENSSPRSNHEKEGSLSNLRTDLEKVGITERELGWLRAKESDWKKLLRYIQYACLQARPNSESVENVDPKRVYELARKAFAERGQPTMKKIGLLVGLQRDRVTTHFLAGTRYRAAYDLAKTGEEWPDDFEEIYGTIVMSALTAKESWDIQNFLDHNIRWIIALRIRPLDPALAIELGEECTSIKPGNSIESTRAAKVLLIKLARKIYEFEKTHVLETPEPADESVDLQSERIVESRERSIRAQSEKTHARDMQKRTIEQCSERIETLRSQLNTLPSSTKVDAIFEQLADLSDEIDDMLRENAQGWSESAEQRLERALPRVQEIEDWYKSLIRNE